MDDERTVTGNQFSFKFHTTQGRRSTDEPPSDI